MIDKKLSLTIHNRKISDKAVETLMDSMRVNRYFSSKPIEVVDATHPAFDNSKLVDADTGEEITDRNLYKVIIDGQHRYKAAKELGLEPTYMECEGEDPIKYLIISNTTQRTWSNDELMGKVTDFIEDNGVKDFITNIGVKAEEAGVKTVSPGVISLYLTGLNNKLGRDEWYKVLHSGKISVSTNVKRANELLEVLIKVCDIDTDSKAGKVYKKIPFKKYLIEAIRNLAATSENLDAVINAVKQIKEEDLKELSEAKGQKAISAEAARMVKRYFKG